MPNSVKHLEWNGDSLGIPFAHSKEAQLGDDPTKKLPRHCYCNPLDFKADYASCLFQYMAMFPDVIRNFEGPLFPGSSDAQAVRFCVFLKS